MENILYLLLIAFGALLMLSVFQFSIYLQQKDKAYLHYSIYLFIMAAFNAVRILDARLTHLYPLSLHTVETLDSVFSNLGFLMYVNFLGGTLNISKDDGKGFNAAMQQNGNGLNHMRQRTENLGGTISINAAEGKGTTISCEIPITRISDS